MGRSYLERAAKVIFSRDKSGSFERLIIVFGLSNQARNIVRLPLDFVAVEFFVDGDDICDCIAVVHPQLLKHACGRRTTPLKVPHEYFADLPIGQRDGVLGCN